jgi:hypothetical protein
VIKGSILRDSFCDPFASLHLELIEL